MIHYQLRCATGHGFDGWFCDSAAFDKQCAAGLTECPACGSTDVRRAPMAPAVGRKGREKPVQVETTAPEPATPSPVAAAGALPDGLRAMLQRVRAEVEKRCDYVGNEFAAEARRIHHGESERRGIYGEASPEDAERLAEDGIEVARIPWVPRADG